MYKLVIFFLPTFTSPKTFSDGWQKFLGMAEQMPGLRKEVVSDVEDMIFGPRNLSYKKIHELYFDSQEDLEAALNSEAGQKAGQWLHSFTQGQFLLVTAKHMEATPEEFKKETSAQGGIPREASPTEGGAEESAQNGYGG